MVKNVNRQSENLFLVNKSGTGSYQTIYNSTQSVSELGKYLVIHKQGTQNVTILIVYRYLQKLFTLLSH